MAENDLLRLARASGVTRRELARYVELDAIAAAGGGVDAVGRRLRRLHRLRRDLGLDVETAALVARLLDQMDVSTRRARDSRH